MPNQPPSSGDDPGRDAATELSDDDVASIGKRLAFLELSSDDQARLRELGGPLGAYSEQFVERFYRHLFAFEETANFLGNAELVARLKQAQQRHLQSMLEASWDESYVQQRRRVGDAHAQIGIDPQMFLGAYNQYLQFASQVIHGEASPAEQRRAGLFASLLKAVLLDIGLTLDAYFAQATQDLRQALELVFKANAELRNFAQLTSHDLKTPLATVANLCDEALDEFGDQMPGEAKKLIEAARSRTFRMSKLIDELLTSTLDLQHNHSLEVVSVGDLVHEIIDQLRPEIAQKQIEVLAAPDLPRVLGQPVRLREALFNLISNAIKYMDKPRGRIVIDAESRGHECVLSVTDNGPGIPPEELSRIFAPFARLRAHHNLPGTGLGLYFTRNMIEQQGGRVWAESKPGQGARFLIALKPA